MQHDYYNQHAGAPMMQAADQAAASDFGEDVAQAVIGVAGRGRVVKCQQRAGERLYQKEEDGDAAEDLMPAAGGRNLFVQKVADGGLDARAMIQPAHTFSFDECRGPSSSLPFSTLVS